MSRYQNLSSKYPLKWPEWKGTFEELDLHTLLLGALTEKLSKYPQVKKHNSASIIEFAQVVNSFVSLLAAENFFSDLQSSSNLSLVVSKLPIILRESWFGFVDRQSVVNLITFGD